MLEKIDKLEHIAVKLGQADSLLGFLEDYFEETDPSKLELVCRYKMYASLFYVINDIVYEQYKAVETLAEAFLEIFREQNLVRSVKPK